MSAAPVPPPCMLCWVPNPNKASQPSATTTTSARRRIAGACMGVPATTHSNSPLLCDLLEALQILSALKHRGLHGARLRCLLLLLLLLLLILWREPQLPLLLLAELQLQLLQIVLVLAADAAAATSPRPRRRRRPRQPTSVSATAAAAAAKREVERVLQGLRAVQAAAASAVVVVVVVVVAAATAVVAVVVSPPLACMVPCSSPSVRARGWWESSSSTPVVVENAEVERQRLLERLGRGVHGPPVGLDLLAKEGVLPHAAKVGGEGESEAAVGTAGWGGRVSHAVSVFV